MSIEVLVLFAGDRHARKATRNLLMLDRQTTYCQPETGVEGACRISIGCRIYF
jgi:hypothetical protein